MTKLQEVICFLVINNVDFTEADFICGISIDNTDITFAQHKGTKNLLEMYDGETITIIDNNNFDVTMKAIKLLAFIDLIKDNHND